MNYTFSDKIASLQPSAIREILKFTADPTVISFAAGNPAPEAFPVSVIQKITEDILSENPIAALQYSITEGYTPLRIKVKEMLKNRYQISSDNDELVITSGAQQAIELTCKVLCNEGDTVICESPSFIGSLNSFRSYNVNLVGVDIEEDGINIEKLEQTLKSSNNVRFIYLIPNFQNPSGITMSLQKRKAVLELAKKYNVLILEDNPYGDLRFEGEDIPSIKSLDTEGHVIYCGSFSKVLSPGLRVGYVYAPTPVISKIVVAKQTSDVHTNILAQMICNKFLQEQDFDAHIQMLRKIYKNKCSLMLNEIEKQFNQKITYTKPEGGLFIWCTLPKDTDMMNFCKTAVENKVAVVPGNAFTANETDPTWSFRMNFSTPKDEQIIKGVKILGELTKTIL